MHKGMNGVKFSLYAQRQYLPFYAKVYMTVLPTWFGYWPRHGSGTGRHGSGTSDKVRVLADMHRVLADMHRVLADMHRVSGVGRPLRVSPIGHDRNSIVLFSSAGLQLKWAVRITDLLGVQVVQCEGLPRNMSEMQVSSGNVGRSSSGPRCISRPSNDTLQPAGSSQGASVKRPKVTSGAEGISPDTNSARTPSKKLSRRRIDFSSSVQCKLIHYKHAINDTNCENINTLSAAATQQQQPRVVLCSLLHLEVPPPPIKLMNPLPLQESTRGTHSL